MSSLLSKDAADLAAEPVLRRLSGGSIVITGDGKLLVECRLGTPAFRPPNGGEAFARPIAVGRVLAGGEATRFAVLDADGVPVISGSVGDDLVLDERFLTAGEEVFISSGRYVQETA